MEQAADFLAECRALHDVLLGLEVSDWNIVTQFKGWTLNDIVVHLHFWNGMADLSLRDEVVFLAGIGQVFPRIQSEGFRTTENALIDVRGPELCAAWWDLCSGMGERWSALDPKQRVKWVGPDMSVRSAITARQMETWAHGQAIFDILGLQRSETDRLKNIVILGVNTFDWSFRVRDRVPPHEVPHLTLTAPTGATWEFGEPGEHQISGSAAEFAQVVTQTRNIEDTALAVNGAVAREWMANAQCFAGAPETPPSPGVRHRLGR